MSDPVQLYIKDLIETLLEFYNSENGTHKVADHLIASALVKNEYIEPITSRTRWFYITPKGHFAASLLQYLSKEKSSDKE